MELPTFEEYLEYLNEVVYDDDAEMNWRMWTRRTYFGKSSTPKRPRKNSSNNILPNKPSEKPKRPVLATVNRPNDSDVESALPST